MAVVLVKSPDAVAVDALLTYVNESKGGEVCLHARRVARLTRLQRLSRVFSQFLLCLTVAYISAYGVAPRVFNNKYNVKTLCYRKELLAELLETMKEYKEPCRNLKNVVLNVRR